MYLILTCQYRILTWQYHILKSSMWYILFHVWMYWHVPARVLVYASLLKRLASIYFLCFLQIRVRLIGMCFHSNQPPAGTTSCGFRSSCGRAGGGRGGGPNSGSSVIISAHHGIDGHRSWDCSCGRIDARDWIWIDSHCWESNEGFLESPAHRNPSTDIQYRPWRAHNVTEVTC